MTGTIEARIPALMAALDDDLHDALRDEYYLVFQVIEGDLDAPVPTLADDDALSDAAARLVTLIEPEHWHDPDGSPHDDDGLYDGPCGWADRSGPLPDDLPDLWDVPFAR